MGLSPNINRPKEAAGAMSPSPLPFSPRIADDTHLILTHNHNFPIVFQTTGENPYQKEPISKCLILFKIKKNEHLSRRNTPSISGT